jgi:hypothetical protein
MTLVIGMTSAPCFVNRTPCAPTPLRIRYSLSPATSQRSQTQAARAAARFELAYAAASAARLSTSMRRRPAVRCS